MSQPISAVPDLDAIRERRAKAKRWYGGVHYGHQLYADSSADVPALLAEVERLRAGEPWETVELRAEIKRLREHVTTLEGAVDGSRISCGQWEKLAADHMLKYEARETYVTQVERELAEASAEIERLRSGQPWEELFRQRDEAIAERDRLRVIVERANWCDCGIGASEDGLCDNSALATQPHAENCPARDRALAAETQRLRCERDQYKAESERLGDVANRLVQRATFERDRANEAARLSAEARDAAEDLRAKIANQGETIADLESQRLDRDAWAVRVCAENGLYELPLDVDDEFGAIAKAFRVYRKDLATSAEAFDVAVKGREDAITERDRYAEVIQAARLVHAASAGFFHDGPAHVPVDELVLLIAAVDRLGDDDG